MVFRWRKQLWIGRKSKDEVKLKEEPHGRNDETLDLIDPNRKFEMKCIACNKEITVDDQGVVSEITGIAFHKRCEKEAYDIVVERGVERLRRMGTL